MSEVKKKYSSQKEVSSFEDFDDKTVYSSGDIVRYENKLYKFISNKSAGSWDSTKVQQTDVVSILSGMIGILSSLQTTAKNNLVAAINEVKGNLPTSYFVELTQEEETEEPTEITEERFREIDKASVIIAPGGFRLFRMPLGRENSYIKESMPTVPEGSDIAYCEVFCHCSESTQEYVLYLYRVTDLEEGEDKFYISYKEIVFNE